MTVALAALCGYPDDVYIVAAEDHMVTYGDVEFEQPQPKMWQLHTHCVAMLYGSGTGQSRIALDTSLEIADRGVTTIDVMAETYARVMRDYIRKKTETEVLAPFGLTILDLTHRPSPVDPSLGSELGERLRRRYHEMANELGGAIVIGVDPVAYIFRVARGQSTLMNSAGFVAAGSGQWHAESQFMFAGYTRWWPFANALSLLYAAKKRAEVAPGVGPETDIVLMTTRPPNMFHIRHTDTMVQGLDEIYKETRAKQDAEFESQHDRVKAFLDQILKPSPSPSPSPAPDATPVSHSDAQTTVTAKGAAEAPPPAATDTAPTARPDAQTTVDPQVAAKDVAPVVASPTSGEATRKDN